ncbi:MAG: DUF1819 family protein [Adlercreutzia sp.]|uniref:DUF1819 family protein n=1 Tax=uncultured Adlercreutzia sp. TaxID=875803 RepID=UPI0021737E05|nr:DUF1819 family protein [uncultured Adlercreutzia sp.]MCI8424989.1 DUF1819 family protein [Adlercreutzia sp.]
MMERLTRKDGSLAREHFMLRELRLVARLRFDGAPDDEIIAAAVNDNLFQYPTTVEAARVARTMLLRLKSLNDEGLVGLAARGPKERAAQINLYAMMRVYPLMAAFMTEEIAPRLRTLDYSLTRADVNAFLARYQATHPEAAALSDASVKRIGGVLMEALHEAGYRPSPRSEELLPFVMDPCLEDAIYRNGDTAWLPAFNEMEVL